MDDWLSSYVKMLKGIINRNQKFLETKGKILRDVVERYLETWSNIHDIVLETDRDGNTVMYFAVCHLWFPSGVFSLIYDVLFSDIVGILRTLRFALEAIEIGLIGDCNPNLWFQGKTLEKKVEELDKIRSSNILKALEPLVDRETMKSLKNIYTRSSQLIHVIPFWRELIKLSRETKDLPSILLYYPDLSELEPKIIGDLVELIEQFCRLAERLILIWKDCISRRDLA